MTTLTADELTVARGKRVLCRNLALRLLPGEIWALLGRNGSGKTSLLETLAGLQPPAAGNVQVLNRPISAYSRKQLARILCFLPQHHHDPFPCTVLEEAITGRHPHLGTLQWENARDYAMAREALLRMELADHEEQPIHSLSGGERRRLGVASRWVQRTRVWLLDEPVNELDPHHQIGVLNKLARVTEENGDTVVMSLHDINLAARFCNRFLLLYGDGSFFSGHRSDALTPQRLDRLYGHRMLALQGPHGPLFYPA